MEVGARGLFPAKVMYTDYIEESHPRKQEKKPLKT